VKIDPVPSETTVETEVVEVAGAKADDSHDGSPSPKKMKMSKGDDVGFTRSSNLKGVKDAKASSSSLNSQVSESFWRSDFHFRRYAFACIRIWLLTFFHESVVIFFILLQVYGRAGASCNNPLSQT